MKKKFYNLGARSDTNWAVQLQKMARGLKFLDLGSRGIVLYKYM